MTHLPSVGPRTVHTLWKELGVDSVEELAASMEGQISSLKGFGKKSAEKILRAARTYNAPERRMLLDEATALGEEMLEFVRSHPATSRAEVGGSLAARRRPLATSTSSQRARTTTRSPTPSPSAPFADEVLAHGPKKVFIVREGVEIDLRIVEPEAFGSLLHHFTGGQAHNIALRERAVKMGINISEYGLAEEGTGNYEPVATEEELYGRLGLPYIPPELREDTGEIEAAERGELPELI